jgi:hypothetical protein
MPTIPQLPTATATGAQDEIPVSQSGITRAVTVAELLSGTQAAIEVPSQVVLGRASLGPGGPEALAIGVGVGIQSASLVANGGDHATFAQEPAFAVGDEVILNSSGTPTRLPVPALRALFSGGANVTIATTGVIAASTDPSVVGSLTTLSQGVASAVASIAVLGTKIPAGGFAALNNAGQMTAPVAGDTSLGTVLTAPAGVPRTLQHRAADRLNVLDFGAVQGGPDCTAAFNAAVSQLPGGGGAIYVPSGDYCLQSSIVIAGKVIAIHGEGRGITRIHLQHTGVGFDIAPGSVLSKVALSGFSLLAESSTGQTAAGIRITYPSAASVGYVTAAIHDVEFFSYPNPANGTAPFPQTFLRGIVLDGCWSTQITNVSWFGPPAAAGTTSSAVVEVNRSFDTRLTGIMAYYGNAVVLQTGYCEGIYINNPLVVGTDYLVAQTDQTQWQGYVFGKPMLLGLWVSNGEVNTNLGTVRLAAVTGGLFIAVDITRDGGPNTPQTMFALTNVSNFQVNECNFVGGPAGGGSADTAFSFTSTFNSSHNLIAGCHFEDMATVIQINGSNGTVGLITYGLQLDNVPLATAIIDGSNVQAGNFVSFMTPPAGGVPTGIGNTKDHVFSNVAGGVLFQVNNVAAAANFIRHQPATSSNPPTVCFDGSDGTVNGAIQTKGGNLFVNAAGGGSASGNMISLMNTAGATNWLVTQNATSGNLSLITTNAGGMALQPKGALWFSPSTGIFIPGLPTAKPTAGSNQLWNNGGVLSIA